MEYYNYNIEVIAINSLTDQFNPVNIHIIYTSEHGECGAYKMKNVTHLHKISCFKQF